MEIKERYPDTEVYIHYMDIRAAYRGFEEFYAETRNKGINFLRGRVAQVEKVGDKLLVRVKDADFHIEGISHQYSLKTGRWLTYWELSEADAQAYWVLGIAGLSELGETTYLAY